MLEYLAIDHLCILASHKSGTMIMRCRLFIEYVYEVLARGREILATIKNLNSKRLVGKNLTLGL